MKTAVISGGSDGLGRAIAEQLKNKYQVVIVSPTADKLKSVAQELGVDYAVCDVSQYEQCTKVISEITQKYGSVDVVINNAGLWIEGELDSNDPAYLKKVVEVNGLGAIYFAKAAVPQMKKQKSGTIININSQAGFYAKPEKSVYAQTKWGLTGFSKALQPELAKYGIKVTDVHPGKMKTKLFEKAGVNKNLTSALNPQDAAQVIGYIISLPDHVLIPEIGIKCITD